MGLHRFQCRLWVVGLAGCVWLGAGMSAVAESVVEESVAVEIEIVGSHRSGHNCFDLATEQPEPLGEFRRAVMETAAVTARAEETIEEKADALANVSKAYACLGQVELADAIAQEALFLVEEIEGAEVQGSLLVTLAKIYGDNLNDSVRMDSLLVGAIALAEAAPQDSAEQYALINGTIRFYIDREEYEKVRSVVDIVENPSIREELVQTSLWFVSQTASEDERTRLFQLFPELNALNSAARFGAEDYELSPFQDWLFNLFYQQDTLLQGAEQDEFVASQLATIERFPDELSQAYGYTFLGSYLLNAGYKDQALPTLNLAVQKLESSQQGEISDELAIAVGNSSVEGFLGATLILFGDFDRGLALIKQMDSSPEQLMLKVSAFIQATQSITSEGSQTGQVDQLMEEAEQAARVVEGLPTHLFDVAFAYIDFGNLAAARRLAQEMQVSFELTASEPASEDYGSLAYLLFELGNYEDGLEALSFVDDSEAFADIAVDLIEQGQDDVAMQILARITSPVEKIYALTYAADTYQILEQPEAAFDLVVRALEVFNSTRSADFMREDNSAYNYGVFNNLSEAELADAVRESALENILYLAESDEEARSLVQLVEDDTLRNQFLESFFSEDTVADGSDPDTQTANYDLSRTASTAASEERYQDAVEAVAMIASSVEQSRALLNIAKCYAYSTTVLDAATASVLDQIQQRYQ